MNLKKLYFITTILLSLSSAGHCLVPVPPVKVTAKNIVGEWSKKYFLQDGNRNSDPRWVLKIVFQEDKKFICDSISTQEVGLTNGTTKGIETKTYLEGSWRLEEDKVIIKFSKDLNEDEKEITRINLGYDDQIKEAVVNLSLQNDSLVLQGVNSERILYFMRENISKEEALAIAQKVCEEEGWEWKDAKVNDVNDRWEIITHSQQQGGNAIINIDKMTGAVLKKDYIFK